MCGSYSSVLNHRFEGRSVCLAKLCNNLAPIDLCSERWMVGSVIGNIISPVRQWTVTAVQSGSISRLECTQ